MSENEEREAVRATAEHLYAAFRHYPLRRQIHACPHCVGPDDQMRLRSKALGSLTGEDLGRYAGKAMTTWGDEEDFKHFLPRLLELSIERSSRVNLSDVVNKLSYAGWERWPGCERAAVHEYLIALWRFALSSFPAPENAPDPVSYLENIDPIVSDYDPFLEVLLNDPSEGAVRLLAQLVGWNGPYWLCNSATLEALEQAFFRYASKPFADELAEAADRVYWAQKVGWAHLP